MHEQRRAVLDQIANKCGLAPTIFQLNGDDELVLRPEPTSSYTSIDCVLGEIKNSKIPFKLGFVGNEAYVGNEE